MLTEVDDFVVFLQEVALQGLPLSAFVVAVLALEPVGKDSRLLAGHRGQWHATCIAQLGRSSHSGPHNRLDYWQVENLSSKADGGLVVVLGFHLDSDEVLVLHSILLFRILKECPLEDLLQVVHNLEYSLLGLNLDLDGRHISFRPAAVSRSAWTSLDRHYWDLLWLLLDLNLRHIVLLFHTLQMVGLLLEPHCGIKTSGLLFCIVPWLI